MRFYDPLASRPTKKTRDSLAGVVAGSARQIIAGPTSENACDSATGDNFPPVELLEAARSAPAKRRVRERKRLKKDPRRPAHTPEDKQDAGAESWDFGADPMLWARTRYGSRVLREKLFSDAQPFRGPGAWLGRIFGGDAR